MKIRDEGFVRNKAVYIALGIQPDGTKEVLGIWIEQTEGAKFWMRVMTELKNRGIADILIAVVPSRRCRYRLPGNGWAEGLSRCDHRRVSQDRRPDPGSESGAGSASCT